MDPTDFFSYDKGLPSPLSPTSYSPHFIGLWAFCRLEAAETGSLHARPPLKPPRKCKKCNSFLRWPWENPRHLW